MNAAASVLEEVRAVVVRTLGVEQREAGLTASTQLMDSLPEFDSMAVLQVVLALEEHFGITVDAGEVTGEIFETLGSLAAFVQEKVA